MDQPDTPEQPHARFAAEESADASSFRSSIVGKSAFGWPSPHGPPHLLRPPHADELAVGRPSIRRSIDQTRADHARRQKRLDEIREKYDGKRAAKKKAEKEEGEKTLMRVLQSTEGVPEDLKVPDRRGSLLADLPRFMGAAAPALSPDLAVFDLPRRPVSPGSPLPPSRPTSGALAAPAPAPAPAMNRHASVSSLASGRAPSAGLAPTASMPELVTPRDPPDYGVTPRTKLRVDSLIERKLRMLKAEDYQLQQAALANTTILSGPAAFPSPAYAAELRSLEVAARSPAPAPAAHRASDVGFQLQAAGAGPPSPGFEQQRRRRVSLAVSIDLPPAALDFESPAHAGAASHRSLAQSEALESHRADSLSSGSRSRSPSPGPGAPGSPSVSPMSARRSSAASRRPSLGRRNSSIVGRRQSLMGTAADIAAVASNAYVNDEDVELEVGRAKDRPNSQFIRMISRRSLHSNAYSVVPVCWTPSRSSGETVRTLRNQQHPVSPSDDFALARKMARAAVASPAGGAPARTLSVASLGPDRSPSPASPTGERAPSLPVPRRPATVPTAGALPRGNSWGQRPSTAPASGGSPASEAAPAPEGGSDDAAALRRARAARLAEVNAIMEAVDLSLVSVPVLLSSPAQPPPPRRSGPGMLHPLERAPPLSKAGINIVSKSTKRLKPPERATLVVPPAQALVTASAHAASPDF